MFQFSSNFLERVNLFRGLNEMLSTNEIQAIKPHLINTILIFVPILIMRYATLKYNQYLFEKTKKSNTEKTSDYEQYIVQREIITRIFNFFFIIITIVYLFLQNK